MQSMEKPELNWSSELMKEELTSELIQNMHEVYTHFKLDWRVRKKTSHLPKYLKALFRSKQKNKEKKTKRQTEGARGWGCAVGKKYSLSNAGLLNLQASL